MRVRVAKKVLRLQLDRKRRGKTGGPRRWRVRPGTVYRAAAKDARGRVDERYEGRERDGRWDPKRVPFSGDFFINCTFTPKAERRRRRV